MPQLTISTSPDNLQPVDSNSPPTNHRLLMPRMSLTGAQLERLSSSNSLTVNNQFLKPRRSLIGSRLERSSFQSQRLSNVGAAVSQQLTANIGLKLPSSQDRIVEQTRWLYLRYVLLTLRQNSLPLKDLNLTKSNSSKEYLLDTTINDQIFNVIMSMISNLKDLRPKYYGDAIYQLVNVDIDKFANLQNLLDVQIRICQEMTRIEITWCRIAALFSLFASMSLDCVQLGTPEKVGPILEGFIGFVERDLALWISQQGGWESFLYKHKSCFTISYLTPAIIGAIIIPIFACGLMDLFKLLCNQ